LYGKDTHQRSNGYERADVEAAYGSIKPLKPRQRFRDAIQYTIQDQRTADMKKKLIDAVDHEALEKFRKSEESVRLQQTKTVIRTLIKSCSLKLLKTRKSAHSTKSRTNVLTIGSK
jgi:hypothetical protein